METLAREAQRWLRQAEYDLKVSEWNQQGGFFGHACFWAYQSAVKSLKAFLFLNNEDARETRSVAELLDMAIAHDESFKEFVGSSTRLDLYYKTSRFPDALPGGIPSEVLTEKDSKEAIKQAGDILAHVERKRKTEYHVLG